VFCAWDCYRLPHVTTVRRACCTGGNAQCGCPRTPLRGSSASRRVPGSRRALDAGQARYARIAKCSPNVLLEADIGRIWRHLTDVAKYITAGHGTRRHWPTWARVVWGSRGRGFKSRQPDKALVRVCLERVPVRTVSAAAFVAVWIAVTMSSLAHSEVAAEGSARPLEKGGDSRFAPTDKLSTERLWSFCERLISVESKCAVRD
jgi:hypothetical protein